MSRPGKRLTDEDRVLWSLVAKSAKPLKGKRPMEEEVQGPAAEKMPSVAVAIAAAQAPVPPKASSEGAFI